MTIRQTVQDAEIRCYFIRTFPDLFFKPSYKLALYSRGYYVGK